MSTDLDEAEILRTSLGHVGRRGMRPWGIHGIAHWWRVRHNGLLLAERTGADRQVVRLFALLHDSFREDDGRDPGHGPRAAAWIERVRAGDDPAPDAAGAAIRAAIASLAQDRLVALREACRRHTSDVHHDDPTVATCFAADRLDLWRVGIMPDPRHIPLPRDVLDEEIVRRAVDRTERGLGWTDREEFRAAWGIEVPRGGARPSAG